MSSLLPDLWGNGTKSPHAFESLHNEIDRVFDQFRRNVELPLLFRKGGKGGLALTPEVDVVETEKSVEISAELPGVDEKDIDVTANDNLLVIKGEKKLERQEEKDNVFVSERSYGMFQRSIPVGFQIDPNTVDAKFTNGVLKVSLPKPPEAQVKPKKIKVKATG